MAASANGYDMASSTNAINTYTQQQDLDRFRAWESQNQVTSVNQFADVMPTDWAYQALSNLVERYGCVAGYPNGTFGGGKAMSRYEAAALLNACLDRVTETTEELQRLLNDFQKELAVIRGRVDGLEAKVGQLEATQFSTTTKLRGEASFIIGGVDNWKSSATTNANSTTFNYDVRLSFDTSFSGKDLLRTRLRSGNFSSDPFGSSGNAFKLDKAESGNGTVAIDRLFYTFPVGNEVKLTVGALVRNTEMVSFVPTAYKSSILDFFNLAGSTGTYNKATGAGAGFSWKQKVKKGSPFASFDLNWVSQNGYADSSIGAFSSAGGQNILAQLGVKGQNWGTAVAYRYGSERAQLRDPNTGSGPRTLNAGQSSNSVSLAGYWQPMKAGWVPSISAGFSYTGYTNPVLSATRGSSEGNGSIWSWMTGLKWDNVFMKGNSAGFALGMPLFVEGSSGMMYEVFYKYKVSDNITVTPSLFWISNSYNDSNNGSSSFGGVIQTTFKF
ncbi:MAG: iron uptake porin [Cyanobacteriota bacterium]|nr:iron uptake porin [Cyanobacteriota bacterium]